MTLNGYEVSFKSGENILELGSDDGGTTLQIYWKPLTVQLKRVNLCYVIYISIIKKRNRYLNQPTNQLANAWRQPTQVLLIRAQGLSPDWHVCLAFLASWPWAQGGASPAHHAAISLGNVLFPRGLCQDQVWVLTTHGPHAFPPCSHL